MALLITTSNGGGISGLISHGEGGVSLVCFIIASVRDVI